MGGIWRQPSRTRSSQNEGDKESRTIMFNGGHNVGAPSVSINDNQSSMESGWGIDDSFPALHTRKGRVTVGTSGGGIPYLLGAYQTSTLVRAVGTKIQSYNGSTWSDIATGLTGADWGITNFEVGGKPAIILTNGTDSVKYWDGTTFGDLSPDAPKGKYVVTDTIRTWIAKGSVLYYSAFLDAQDWTSPKNSGSVEFYTPKGGDITALSRYAERTVAFKENSMAEIHGTNYFEFRLMDISLDIGCVNAKTLQEVQGLLLWLGPGLDVYVYTGGRPKAIGQMIRGYLNRVNTAHLDKCFASSDGLHYYLGLVLDDNTEPKTLLVYDPVRNLWRVYQDEYSYRMGYSFKGDHYLMDSTGQAYKVSGYTDGGSTIESTYVTKAFDEGIPQAEKEFHEAHIQGYIPTGSTVAMYISRSVHGDDFTHVDTITGSSDSQSADIIIPMDTVPLCKWYRIKLVTTGEVTLYQMQLTLDIHPIQV